MADILHRITIDAAPDRVFDALTVSESLQSWWTRDSHATTEIGSVAVFKFIQGTIVFRMRVEELVPGERVAWLCQGDPQEWEGTQLTWELESTESGGPICVLPTEGGLQRRENTRGATPPGATSCIF